jgi:hypothetical protein
LAIGKIFVSSYFGEGIVFTKDLRGLKGMSPSQEYFSKAILG